MRPCFCGRSTTYPRCDGSHAEEGWTCQREVGVLHPLGLVAAPMYRNLIDRLAAEVEGAVVQDLPGPVEVARLVVITDGTDLLALRVLLERTRYQDLVVFGLGVESGILAPVLGPGEYHHVLEDDALEIHDAILGDLAPSTEGEVRDRRGGATTSSPFGSVFLSHAVADEDRIMPAIAYLRSAFSVPVFVCGDSIPAGTAWMDQILEGMGQADVFCLVISEASDRSRFCAFEIGFALGRGLPVRLVSLDGSPPAPYVQHLQMIDVPRRQRLKPWRSEEQVLIQALFEAFQRGF